MIICTGNDAFGKWRKAALSIRLHDNYNLMPVFCDSTLPPPCTTVATTAAAVK